MPENLHPWRRLLAFYFDLLLFMVPFELVWLLIDMDNFLYFTTLYYGLPLALMKIFTALPLISLVLYRFGTTPGKWLMGMRLLFPKDTGFTKLYKRTVFAYVAGTGMQLATISVMTLFISFRFLLTTGQTFWDRSFSTKVMHSRLQGGKIAAFVSLLIVCSALESLPLTIDLVEQLGLYSYSPTYCTLTVKSGSVTATEDQIELTAEAADGRRIQAESGGGAYSLDERLSAVERIRIRVSEDFHAGLPAGLEISLLVRNAPNAMLALVLDVSVLREPEADEAKVTLSVRSSNRSTQLWVYENMFVADIDPDNPSMSVELFF